MKALNTPFRQALALLVGAYVLIDFGIPYLPPLLGIDSAPVPNTVVFQYLMTVGVGILLWVSDNEERWGEFKKPIHEVLVLPERRIARNALLVIVPLLVAFIAFDRASPDVSAPPSFRAIHPAPPPRIPFRGEAMELTGLENPLRSQGSEEEHYEEASASTTRTASPVTATPSTGSVSTRMPSTRLHSTSRTSARSLNSRRASSSGESRRAARGCLTKARPGIRRCPRGRTSSRQTRSGR